MGTWKSFATLPTLLHFVRLKKVHCACNTMIRTISKHCVERPRRIMRSVSKNMAENFPLMSIVNPLPPHTSRNYWACHQQVKITRPLNLNVRQFNYTMSKDTLPASYKYAWSDKSERTLQDFLTKFKPSMVQNDGTKPWIWVHGCAPLREDTGVAESREEAAKLLKEVTEKVENIKNDDSIPLRSSEKTGAKSKKEVREQVQTEATNKLKEIAIKHGYLTGKWILFASADKVDMIWSSIATSLVSGPLSSTSAFLAKVSTSPEQETANVQHLICVYLPDVYNKASVTEVMKVLLRNHGVNLSGVKSDLYTTIGIDSKHPSGIASTVWKNAAILSEEESKELKDAFFAEMAQNKPAPVDNPAESNNPPVATTSTKGKGKPKLKKKISEDPFASDNDDQHQDKA